MQAWCRGGLIFLLLTASCASTQVYTRSQLLMGHVPVHISVLAKASEKKAVFAAMDAAYLNARNLEAKISEYQTNSDISCLNVNAGKKACLVSDQTYALLQLALKLEKKLGRYFNIRFASPTRAARFAKITLDATKRTAMLTHPQSKIGIGAIGKGYILDDMISQSAFKQFPQVLINAGDLVAKGGPWNVEITYQTSSTREPLKTLSLSDRALATSGNDEQKGHIVDPVNGKAVERNASVSVIGPQLATADALATACYVMGKAKAQELLEKNFPEYHMLWLNHDSQ